MFTRKTGEPGLKSLRFLLSPAKYSVGQKVHLGFSVRSYRKTQTNFLGNPIHLTLVVSFIFY